MNIATTQGQLLCFKKVSSEERALETADLVFVKFFEWRAVSMLAAACFIAKMVSSCKMFDAALIEARKNTRQRVNERNFLMRVFLVDPKSFKVILLLICARPQP